VVQPDVDVDGDRVLGEKAGIPLVASIAFQPNKLDDFLFRGTDGHLLVIGGFTASGDVISYDPASAGDATVRTTARRSRRHG
jgi:hypothetical protein